MRDRLLSWKAPESMLEGIPEKPQDSPPPRSSAELLPPVYHELRRLAERKLARAQVGHTWQPTALVHEAYLRLAADPDYRWNDDRHFFAAAAQAIRWVLVDRARQRLTQKHGGGRRPVTLNDVEPATVPPDDELLALDESLQRLEAVDRRKFDVVMLRYFAGLSIEATAQNLGISPATVKRQWNFARAWLLCELEGDGSTADETDDA